MADVDFQKLLSRKVDDAKPPAVLPSGTYRGIIKTFEFGKSREKETPFVKFNFDLIGHEDDVDEAELAEIDVTKIRKSTSFYFTENSEFRLANFIKSCGVKTEGRGYDETIPELVNAVVLVPITQQPDKKDPKKVYNEIGDIVGA